MKKNINQDGGYYAIKGFAYQIDKTILEILNSTDENKKIKLEQIQDINGDDYVIQVKYKETAKLTPSQVTNPIIQLIDLYNSDNSKKYYLYAYFQDTNGYDTKITDKQINKTILEELLGKQKRKYNDKIKNGFIKNFYFDLSTNFQNQFEQVIKKLQELNFGNTFEESIFYYANISDYLYKLVCNNSTSKLKNRTCTKKEILEFVNNGKKLIFNSSYREFLGDEKYFKFIKDRYFTFKNIDNYERFIVIELNGTEKISDIKSTILKIKEKFYKSQNRGQPKSGAPFIYFKNISDENLVKLKKNLLEENHLFKDGHDFFGAQFSKKFLLESSTNENKISIKILNNEYNFKEMIKENYGKTKEIYQFYLTSFIDDLKTDDKEIKIKINNIGDINFIL